MVDDLKTVASICGCLSTIITLITIVIKPIRNRFICWISQTSDKDNLNKKLDKLTTLVEKQAEQNEKISVELDKQSLALQATLRNSILNIYNTRMELGYITLFEKQNIVKLYENYTALNGNSFIHDCIEELNKLPIK